MTHVRLDCGPSLTRWVAIGADDREERETMSKSKKNMPILAQWIEPECAIDDERSVGVTVARKVKLNGIDYEGAVTVEVFGTLGRHSNGALDDDWPETWSGDESATLTPGGARRLAHILTVAADTAYAYRKEIGVTHAEVTPKQSTIDKAVAAEREAVRAEIGQRMSTLLNEFVASESRANAINGELRALRLLVEWLDARSKGGAK